MSHGRYCKKPHGAVFIKSKYTMILPAWLQKTTHTFQLSDNRSSSLRSNRRWRVRQSGHRPVRRVYRRRDYIHKRDSLEGRYPAARFGRIFPEVHPPRAEGCHEQAWLMAVAQSYWKPPSARTGGWRSPGWPKDAAMNQMIQEARFQVPQACHPSSRLGRQSFIMAPAAHIIVWLEPCANHLYLYIWRRHTGNVHGNGFAFKGLTVD